VMILNARQIHFKKDTAFPPIILLAMEDVTEMINVAERLSGHVSFFEEKLTEKTKKLESHIKKLIKEMNDLKKKSK